MLLRSLYCRSATYFISEAVVEQTARVVESGPSDPFRRPLSSFFSKSSDNLE